MSLHEYLYSKTLDKYDPPFYGLLFAMLRKADSENVRLISRDWPEKYEEFGARYHAGYGIIPEDEWPIDKYGFPAPIPDVPLEPEYVHLNLTGIAFAKLVRIEDYIKALREQPEKEGSNAFHAAKLRQLLDDLSSQE
jgi:hypothetical protein